MSSVDKPKLILVHGKARSGKGEVATRLCDKWGYIEVGFADYLKELAVELFGWDPNEIWRDRTPESRRFMQKLGNEIGRAKDPDFWIKKLETRLKGKYFGKNIVISDLRYTNEAEWGKNSDGQLWLVKRPEAETMIEANPEHVSEHDLEQWKVWDRIIINDSTLDSLYSKVDEIVSNKKPEKIDKKRMDDKALLQRDVIDVLYDGGITIDGATIIDGDIITRIVNGLIKCGYKRISFPVRKWKK